MSKETKETALRRRRAVFLPVRKQGYEASLVDSGDPTQDAAAGQKARLENKSRCEDCGEKIKAPVQGCSSGGKE